MVDPFFARRVREAEFGVWFDYCSSGVSVGGDDDGWMERGCRMSIGLE